MITRTHQLLYPHVRLHWPLVLGSLFFALIMAGVRALHAYLVRPLVDSGIQPDSPFSQILFLAVMVVALALISLPVRFYHFYWIRYVAEKGICEIRARIYEKLQRLPLQYFQHHKQGELISSLLNDTHVLARGLPALVSILREFVCAVALAALITYRDWQLALVALLSTPLFFLIMQKSGSGVQAAQSMAQESIAEVTHNLSEGVQGQKLIKAFNIQSYVLDRFKRAQHSLFGFLMRATRAEEMAHPLVEVLASVIFATILLLAFSRISTGAMSPGGFVSFIVSLVLLMEPVRKLIRANAEFSQARAAGQRVINILNVPEEADAGTLAKNHFKHGIEFRDVSFSYGDRDVLKDFSLEIKKDEHVALVGLSGSGKSTLLGLLLRFYNVERGEILIDGVPLKDFTLASLRSLFGLVSQDIFLFNDTVRANILLDSSADDRGVQQALRASYSSPFVAELPQQTETVIGDRGARLSVGQAQRLTIARAYLRQNPILLFDEATSALDNESEKIVQKALNELSVQHTVIAVAHRLSTIQHFDKIVVLKGGRKVEQGTHHHLMEHKGEYYRLYQLSGQTQSKV